MASLKNSVLNLRRLYFEKISFNRLETAASNPDWKMNFHREIRQHA